MSPPIVTVESATLGGACQFGGRWRWLAIVDVVGGGLSNRRTDAQQTELGLSR